MNSCLSATKQIPNNKYAHACFRLQKYYKIMTSANVFIRNSLENRLFIQIQMSERRKIGKLFVLLQGVTN